MGNLHIALSALFKKLGLAYTAPPPITDRTYEIGFRLSPEQVCLPFKICVGNFVEAIEKGADTIVMAGGNGPCRFGFYGVLQEKILKDAGYTAKMMVLNQDNIPEVFSELKRITGVKSRLFLLPSFYFAWKILKLSEKNDKMACYYRAHSSEKSRVETIYMDIRERVLKIDSFSAANKFHEEIGNIYKNGVKTDIPASEVLKVGLLGEIYLVLDEKANMNVERLLGNQNVWVDRTIHLSEWILKLISLDFFSKKSHRAMKRLARPYLASDVGGKGIQTIASAITYAREKFDGLLHITPFSCMPETVATTILPKVCEDNGIACLYLTFDEHTSQAAVVTRIEAFTDMLRMKKGGM